MSKLKVGDVLSPSYLDHGSSVAWKSSLYIIIEEMDQWQECGPLQDVSIKMVNDQGKKFEENYPFITRLIRDQRLNVIEDDDEKAKLMLLGN